MMSEMDEGLRQEAQRLYRQGLALSLRVREPEARQEIVRLWKRARDLYRQAGDLENAGKIGTQIHHISLSLSLSHDRQRHLATASAADADEGPELPFTRRVREAFTDWWVFLKVGCFGVGGPMAIWALLHEELVVRKRALSHRDFMEAAVLGDILPGPVTMDIVTYAGFKLRSWAGAIVSTGTFILPSFLLMLILAARYSEYKSIPAVANMLEYLGAAVTAVVVSVGVKLGEEEIKDYLAVFVTVWSFVSSLVFRLDMVLIIILAGAIGLFMALARGQARPENDGRPAPESKP